MKPRRRPRRPIPRVEVERAAYLALHRGKISAAEYLRVLRRSSS